jgi:small-conductance mechanosensitive channel
MEKTMTENQPKRNSRDRQRINASDGYELNYWTRQLRCTEQELRAAIAAAGPEIAAVRNHLQAKRQRGDDDLVCA